MRPYFLLGILIILSPFCSAYIEVANELNDKYFLGDNIGFSFKVIPADNIVSLAKLTLRCTNKEVSYYITPLELKKGKEMHVDAPSIKAFSEGLCSIRIGIESFGGENIDGAVSKDFLVLNRLNLSVSADKTEVSAGDKIRIKGSASKGKNTIKDGSVVITIDNRKEQIELAGKEFSYDLRLEDNIKSGEHTISVEVNDSYGNYNKENININVEAIPQKLELYFNKNEFLPEESLEFTAYLFDQAGDPIYGDVNIKLFRGKTLFTDEIVLLDSPVKSNTGYYFMFNQSTLPYEYTVRSSFGGLEKEEKIKVLPYQMIKMKVEGNIIHVKNVGNVEYNNETTILLEKDSRKYVINKRIKLDVGEETLISLSEEAPSGSYTIILPKETVREERIIERPVLRIIEKDAPQYKENIGDKSKTEFGTATGLDASNVVEGVIIENDGPFYTKLLRWITGGVVVGSGLLLDKPKLASFIIILIILGFICYYGRERIRRVIKKIREKREKF